MRSYIVSVYVLFKVLYMLPNAEVLLKMEQLASPFTFILCFRFERYNSLVAAENIADGLAMVHVFLETQSPKIKTGEALCFDLFKCLDIAASLGLLDITIARI